MKIALVKSMASELYISDISRKDDLVIFTMLKEPGPETIVSVMAEYKGKMMFSSGNPSYLSYRCDKDIPGNIKIILQKLKNTIHDV